MISTHVSGLRIVSVELTEASLVLVGAIVVVRLGIGAWVCEALGFSPLMDWHLGMQSAGL